MQIILLFKEIIFLFILLNNNGNTYKKWIIDFINPRYFIIL